jgi:drug/metabolite transporter (DMT)-like permease
VAGAARATWPILFVGLLNSGIPFALLAWAVLSISTGMTSILNATVPMFGALVAWVWLKDKPTGSRLLGLAIGFASAWRCWPGTRPASSPAARAGPWWPAWWPRCATALGPATPSATSPASTRWPLATGSQLGATLGLLVPTLWLWPAAMPGPRAWGAVVGLGVLCTGIAYILYFRLIANTGPAKALAVTFLIPVFAVVYGAMALGESITLWMLLCGAVIVLGTALATGFLKFGK